MLKNILTKTSIPKEIIGFERLEYIDGEIIISNYKKIMKWEVEYIETKDFIVFGKKLVIKEMDKAYLKIKGEIKKVEIKGIEHGKKNKNKS